MLYRTYPKSKLKLPSPLLLEHERLTKYLRPTTYH